jgi:drug/metabolite transporter (DMT)-like permease
LPSGIALSFSNILVTFGFNRVESGAGTLLLATTAVTFAVVDVLWPGGNTKPTYKVWGGLTLGLAGVAVLVVGKGQTADSHWSGYLMLALSAWVWAFASVAQARHPSYLDPLQSSTWQMLIAASCAVPIAFLFRVPFPQHIDPRGLYGLVFLIVTASLIGFVGFVYMLRHMPPYIAGSYTYLNSIVAAFTGWLWLGERLDIRFFFAAALVLSSVTLIQLRPRREQTAQST